MWRSVPSRSFFRTLLNPAVDVISLRQAGNPIVARAHPRSHSSSAAASPEHVSDAGEGEPITGAEARRLVNVEVLKRRLVNVEVLKRRLGAMGGAEVIGYAELLKECEAAGVARSREEAAALARALDEAGVVLLFLDKVYLHPDKIVDFVRSSVPLALTPKDDPRREELKQLFKKKEEIDRLAHKQVRHILWSGLGLFIGQIGLFFRLTFWEFSWDIMEPIAFFGTMTGLLVGYAYFVITSRDPTYQDFMERLFSSRQRKLSQKLNFDMERFMELQKHCKFPFNHHMGGTGLQAVHRD